MRFASVFLLLATAVALSLRFAQQLATPAVEPTFTTFATPNVAEEPTRPVVIELFTSEGCSSCPPADSLLQQLEQTSPVAGAELIVLSEHVDYWNYIGWADPFSAPLFSARQQSYARALERRGERGDVYTPQMIVDGQFELVGGSFSQARAAIAKALASPKAAVNLTPANSSSATEPKLHLQVSDLPPLSLSEQIEVLFVVTESKLASNVTHGENAGRMLPHTAVTRSLQRLAQFAGTKKSFETTATITLAGDWKRQNLRVIALVQEQANRRILGAASRKLN